MMNSKMNWWDKMVIPMRKVWVSVSKKIGIRKTGLVKLRKDIRTCEYEDVHILWDMLKRQETYHRKKRSWKIHWEKCSPLLCHRF